MQVQLPVLDQLQQDSGFDKKNAVIIPPNKIPPTKKRFHTSFFQSYLKKEIFIGTQAAHICRNEEETPKDLFPKYQQYRNCKTDQRTSNIPGPWLFYPFNKIHDLKFIIQRY